jgi:hypothetical protein
MSAVTNEVRKRIAVDGFGNSIIWFPSSAETSCRNCEVNFQLRVWAKKMAKVKV